MSRSWPIGQEPNYYTNYPRIGSLCKGADYGTRWREPHVGHVFEVLSVEKMSTEWDWLVVTLKDVTPETTGNLGTLKFEWMNFKESFYPVTKGV